MVKPDCHVMSGVSLSVCFLIIIIVFCLFDFFFFLPVDGSVDLTVFIRCLVSSHRIHTIVVSSKFVCQEG
jgi:hypothetical protein